MIDIDLGSLEHGPHANFKELASEQSLTLVKATAFDCGIVVLHYAPKRDAIG